MIVDLIAPIIVEDDCNEEEASLAFDEEALLVTKNKLRYRYKHQNLPNGLLSHYGSGEVWMEYINGIAELNRYMADL